MSTEDSMPSEMVSAQQLSDAGEDLVRLATAKDAEIAALTKERNAAEKSREEWARQYWAETAAYKSEIATLTEQRDRAMKVVELVNAIPDHNRSSHAEFIIAVGSAKAEALGIKVLAALDVEAAAETEEPKP